MAAQHSLGLADDLEDFFVERGLHDAVIELQDKHVLLVTTKLLSNQLSALYFVVVESSTVLFECLVVYRDTIAIVVLGWHVQKVAAEEINGGLHDVLVTIFVDKLVKVEPRVRFEAHEAGLLASSHKEHNITIGFLVFVEELLLDHLSMVDEADKLPLSQMDDALGHVQGQVDDCDLLVHWSKCLVS